MNTHVEALETVRNGVTGLGFVSAIVLVTEDYHGDRITSRYLVQFAPTFDQASGELNGAQETADGGRIVFITDLNATAESIMGTADITADNFEDILPVIARAWAQQRRESNDAWFAAATANREILTPAAEA